MYSTKHTTIKWKLLLALIFSGLSASVMAQDVNISVSDTVAIAGETLLVPLRISPIDETDAVIAGTFRFSTNESIFEIVGFDKTGTLLENTSNVFYNIGTNTLAFAGTDTLKGSGTLIKLRVKAKDDATYFQYSDVSFDEATLNEGSPIVNATGARWTIKGIQINPRSSGILVLEGDSLQFNLTGNIVEPVSWSVTDTTIGTIDSNGLFAAKTFGLVQVKAVDGQGLRDSTAFFRVQPSTLTELSVTIPDTSIRQTKDIALPIYITDVTGLEVLSADLQVNFNQNYLTLNGVTSTGTITESWGQPTVNTETGSVKIASAGTDTLKGFGTLYYLNFTVKDINTGSFPINFAYANLNEDLSIDLNNGTFTVLAKPTIDVNIPDTAISIGQSIDFAVNGGNGTAPYTWQVDDSSIGSIEVNTGTLTGINRGNVLVNAIDNEGFLSSTINVRVNDFDAYLDSTIATYPDTIEVALRTGELSPFNVLSYQAEVVYDTTKLDFLGLKTVGTQSENTSVEATVDASLKVASAGTTFLGGNDPIVILRFAQKQAIVHLDELILDLKYLSFDEPGADVPTTSPLPGIVDIIRIDPPDAPELVSPADLAVNQDTSLILDWNPANLANEYQLQLSTTEDFTNNIIDSTLAASELSISGLTYLKDYYWRVKASNLGGESPWSETFSFTTIIEKPEIPRLNSPADGTSEAEVSLALNWHSSSRASQYQVMVSNNENFDSVELDSTISDTTFTLTSLNYSTIYYWKVNALNTGGESGFTDAWSFETKIAPTGLPVPLLPAMSESGVDTLPGFTWKKAENAVSYRLQLSTTSDFSNVIDDQTGLTDTTTTASIGLMFATNYFWRVKAFGVDDSTEWSVVFNFTTRFDELAAPILKSPTKNAVDVEDSLTFVWTSVPEADSYDYELSLDTLGTAFVSINQADTMFTQTGLAFDSTYFWRVRANDGLNSRSSVWTPWFAFTVKTQPDAIPIVTNPLGSITLFEDFADTTIADLNTVFEDPGEVLGYTITSNTDLVAASIVGTNLNLSSVQDTSGTAELVIEASDDAGNTVSDTLTVTVTPVNDLPYVVQLPDTLTFKVGEVYGFTIDTAFADVEDELTDFSFNVSVTPADILLSFDPTTYTITLSSPTYIGFGEIVLTVEDSDGGKLEVSLVIEVEMATSNDLMADLPTNFELQQNYPNPFNPSSNIRFGLPESGEVRLDVYNMLGQRVATLVDQRMQAGWHTVSFDASALSSGTYIYRITSGDFVQTKKMMLIK